MIFLLNESRERQVNDSLFTSLNVRWSGPWQCRDTPKPDFTSSGLRFPTLSQLWGEVVMTDVPYISGVGEGGHGLCGFSYFLGRHLRCFYMFGGYKVKQTVPWDQSSVLCRDSWNRTDHWIAWSLSGLHWLTCVFNCDPAELPFLQWYGAHLPLGRGLAKTLTINRSRC